MSRCRSCGAEIVWARTENGKHMPLDAEPAKAAVVQDTETYEYLNSATPGALGTRVVIVDTYVPHFATCPEGQEWSGKGRSV